MLAAGLALGAFLVWRMRRAAPAAAAPHVPVELRDLDGRLDVLVHQLRELQDLAATRSPEQLARERYALELEAAEVWRERERSAPAAAPAKKAKGARAAAGDAAGETAAPVPAASGAGLRGFLWGAGTAAALALLFFYVGRTAKPREEGGSVTGNLPERGGSPAAGEDAAAGAEGEGADAAGEAEIRAALKANPDDLDARLDLAMLHLRKRELMAVWEETQHVLGKQPGHPRALSYQALVRLAMGQADVAERMLKQALATDPNLFEAYLHLALVETQMGRDKEAQAAIDEASRRFPERAQALARVLSEIRTSSAQEGPAATEGDPHAAVPPPDERAGAEAPATPAGAPPGPGIAGVVELSSARASRVGRSAVVFVTVREAGTAGGPPVAVKRLPASFPLRFAIGPGDSMMGQPLPARARLEARVDSDGDPLTRDPSDPKAQIDGVAAGSSGVRLVLQ
jgi:cytochrome c-type biogenesis protein CcmH